MYDRTYWKDSVRDPDRTYKQTVNEDGTIKLEPVGTVIQAGTNMSAEHFNNLECGSLDSGIAIMVLLQKMLQSQRAFDVVENDTKIEVGTVTLTNSAKYPFNNSIETVALNKVRDNASYVVEYSVNSYEGGLPGEITVSNKAVNGFKLEFDGSADSVEISYMIKGGFSE